VADDQIQKLGFGPGDGDDKTVGKAVDQTSVLGSRYNTEDFFVVLADVLNDGKINNNGGVSYEAAKQV